jgi:diguanylate cyclase (GGDEF)-like protein/PAS domain S-box-containing protein
MDPNKPQSPIGQELASLRKRMRDLELLERELSKAATTLNAATGQIPFSDRPSEHIKAEIENRLGFFPPIFTPALESPRVLQNLWQQSLSAYHDNPLPELFKEKLFARLSVYCASPYSIVTHSCYLRRLGVSAAEILRILEQQAPSTEVEIGKLIDLLKHQHHPLRSFPEHKSDLENHLLGCCHFSFLKPAQAGQCNAEVRLLLGDDDYAHLIAFLAYIKTFHLWTEAHPEVSYQSDPCVRSNLLPLLRDEPRLEGLFRDYYQELGFGRQRLEAEQALRASEEKYRELFENAIDIVYTHDLEGNITSINRAAERITGYSRGESLRMNLIDFVAPEHQPIARKMVERQVTGESPATDELEILTKDGRRVALEIRSHPIFRDGVHSGVQGIARDITQRKKTEEALQLAKKNLEAWVEELEQRTREMTLLSEMGDMLRACLTTDEAYSVIVRVAQQIFPGQIGALFVIAPSRNLVEAVAAWGQPSLVERVFAPDECWALRRGRVHRVEDSQVGLLCQHLHQPAPAGYLCIPMMAQSEALGILHLSQPEAVPFTEAKHRLALAMAEHIAMALSNLKLHETLRSQSIRDPLTGLFNRRFMEESLELELRRAVRNQRPLGVIMLDLDRFKDFNDNYGHDAGDMLLRELGILLQTNIRAEDIACRFGGEEFTLILPEGSSEISRQRAETLRDAIKSLDVQHRGQPLGRITASLGVAAFPEHGRTGDALIKAADVALYASKEAGGDRVTTAK